MSAEQSVDYWVNHGARYLNEGRYFEAGNCYRHALALQPEQPHLLGRLAMLDYRDGNLDNAHALLQRAIDLDPSDAENFLAMGMVLRKQGRHSDAAPQFRMALELAPDNTAARYYLAMTLTSLGEGASATRELLSIIDREPDHLPSLEALAHLNQQDDNLAGAAEYLRRATGVSPLNAQLHFELGVMLSAQGNTEGAKAAYKAAINADSRHAHAHNNLGVIQLENNDYKAAIEYFRQALQADPNLVISHFNLGKALIELNFFEHAAQFLQRARELGATPELPMFEILDHLGGALRGAMQLTQAEAVLREAMDLASDAGGPLLGLGCVLIDQGRIEEGVDALQEIAEANPDNDPTFSTYLMALNYDPSLAVDDVLEAHRTWGAAAPSAGAKHSNIVDPNRRLRVGVVSPDLHRHSVAYFIEPFFRQRDRDEVELFVYSHLPDHQEDDVTARLRGLADRWTSIRTLTDDELAALVREHEVDILIDLAGHTDNNRLGLFKRSAAPVQISYLGYPNTTGLEVMNYRLTDGVADPSGFSEAQHVENLLRLDGGFLCYNPDDNAPPVGPGPAYAKGYVTFGSFNNISKIGEPTVTLWAEVLRRVPNSRLLLKHSAFADEGVQRRYSTMFEQHGVDMQRLSFMPRTPTLESHLAQYGNIDIALDTPHYNGATTTCEALWMGVPVVTYPGDRHAARVGASILHHAGLDELIAADADGYVELAVGLAQDLPRLNQLRTSLRDMLRRSSLCNGKRFNRALGRSLRVAWRAWCEKQAV